MTETVPKLRVISLGAGVQSTAMLLMAERGEIGPRPDCAIFADTKWEPKKVYDHLAWLRTATTIPIHVVSAGDLWAAATTVRTTRDGKRTYTATGLPVYTVGGQQNGMGKRQCTRNFKIDPINRKVRELLGRERVFKRDGVLVEMWIGISVDEAMRKKPNAKPFIRSRWPLLERQFTRKACLEWMLANGYPTPPRSACTFCPYHSDAEWLNLTSEEMADAVLKERELQGSYRDATALNTTPYLHESRVPLDQVKFDPTPRPERQWQTDMFINECEGMCGV